MISKVEALSPQGDSSFLKRRRTEKRRKGTASPLAEHRQLWTHPLEVSRGRKWITFILRVPEHRPQQTKNTRTFTTFPITLIFSTTMLIMVMRTTTTVPGALGCACKFLCVFLFHLHSNLLITYLYWVTCSPGSPQTPCIASNSWSSCLHLLNAGIKAL